MHAMYACNPKRAQLAQLLGPTSDNRCDDVVGASAGERLSSSGNTNSELFLLLVELIADGLRNTTSFLEVVNYNVPEEQYVVAGDAVALAVLGKCLDGQYRANNLQFTSVGTLVTAALRSVAEDNALNPELLDPSRVDAPAPADYVRSALKNLGKNNHKRVYSTPDDGRTLPLDRLTSLTLSDDGRSGLKKKSWFIPLAGIDTPFHSSLLRRAMDHFHPVVMECLATHGPSDDGLREIFSQTRWVTNLTGTVFEPDSAAFRALCAEFVESSNIGEQKRNGKYDSVLTEVLTRQCQSGSVRDLLGAILTAQLSHSVQWSDAMSTIIKAECVSDVLEISPVKTLCDMFSRSGFCDSLKTECIAG
jgi:hypothetical protein